MKLSVVIPSYNEEAVIEKTLASLLGTINGLLDEGMIGDCEIVFVDDGSHDRSRGSLVSTWVEYTSK